MTDLMLTPNVTVKGATAAAFAPGLTDALRLDALLKVKGCGSAGPISTVLLTAFDPTSYGVLDKLAMRVLPQVLSPACTCVASDTATRPSAAKTVTYFEHLRAIAAALSTTSTSWTPRMVDMALFKMGGG